MALRRSEINTMADSIALVVEDEKDIARIFAKALRKGGFGVEVVHTGDEAVEWLDAHTPSLVILDLQLPGVSGLEVFAHIRAQRQLSETAVIIVTAYPHIAEDLANQADCVLFKPVNQAELRGLAARFGLERPKNRTPRTQIGDSKEE
jgi:DNA-binding response OmpR family regulator